MKKSFLLVATFLLATIITWAQDVTTTYLTNPSFETGDLSGWTLTGADGYSWTLPNTEVDGTQDGSYVTGVWNRPIGDVEWLQSVTGLPNGTYKVGCLMSVTDVDSWTDGSKRITTQRLFANGKSLLYGNSSDYSEQNLAVLAETEAYSFANLSPAATEAGPWYAMSLLIEITDGNLDLGVRTNGAGSTSAFDFQGEDNDKGFFKFDGFTLTDVSNLLLASVTVGGESMTIDNSTTNYVINLADGTSGVPEVIATAATTGTKVEVIPATTLPGTTEIILTSADDSYSLSYFISFEIPIGLTSLTTSKGYLSPEFEYEVVEYELYVPYGSTSLELTYTATSDQADVTIFDGLGAEIEGSTITFPVEGID